MRGSSVRFGAVALLLFTPAAVLAGEIIYEQPSVSPTVVASTSQYFPDSGLFGFNVFDDFTLIANTSITDVHWRGHYFNSLAPATVPTANASGFGIGIFSDNAGSPGALLAPYAFTPGQAHESLVGTEPLGGIENSIFDYWVDLPVAFDATANTTYWLGIFAFSPLPSDTEAQWGWGRGNTGGTALQYSGSNFFSLRDDRAFALSTAVPEPSSLILLSTALLGLALAARKRTARAQ